MNRDTTSPASFVVQHAPKVLLCLLFLGFLLSFSDVSAQCAMCKANVEAAQGQGRAVGTGLNTGILYLLAAPYLAASVVAFFWYRNYKQQKQEQAAGLTAGQ